MTTRWRIAMAAMMHCIGVGRVGFARAIVICASVAIAHRMRVHRRELRHIEQPRDASRPHRLAQTRAKRIQCRTHSIAHMREHHDGSTSTKHITTMMMMGFG